MPVGRRPLFKPLWPQLRPSQNYVSISQRSRKQLDEGSDENHPAHDGKNLPLSLNLGSGVSLWWAEEPHQKIRGSQTPGVAFSSCRSHAWTKTSNIPACFEPEPLWCRRKSPLTALICCTQCLLLVLSGALEDRGVSV